MTLHIRIAIALITVSLAASCREGSDLEDPAISSNIPVQDQEQSSNDKSADCPGHGESEPGGTGNQGRKVDACDPACLLSIEEADKVLGKPVADTLSDRTYSSQAGYYCAYFTTRIDGSSNPTDDDGGLSIYFRCTTADHGPIKPVDERLQTGELRYVMVSSGCSIGVGLTGINKSKRIEAAELVASKAKDHLFVPPK